jgi:HK97 gp10 family phage protein
MSGVSGGAKVRRKLSRISREADKPIKPVLEEVAQKIVNDAKSRVPVASGALRDSIEYKLSSDGLTVAIAPSIRTGTVRKATKGGALDKNKVDFSRMRAASKEKFFQAVKGYWIEFGTKGGEINARTVSSMTDGSVFYGKQVIMPARPAQPFMNPAYEANKEAAQTKVAEAINKMLDEVARGRS